MTTLQFSLFFAAILVAYLLVHLRLVRFEGHLKEIVALRSLNERVGRACESLERFRLERVEEHLVQLHDDLARVHSELEGLRDATGAVGKVLETVPVQAPRPAPGPSSGGGNPEFTSGERIRMAIETCLLGLGYRDLRILADLSEVGMDEAFQVRIECVKHHMPHKGAVTVRNGGVVDVDLQSVAQSFP